MTKHHGVSQAMAVSATSRDGDSSTCLGSSSQCLITLSVKKFFLMSILNIPWQLKTMSSCPLVWEKRPTWPQLPLTEFYRVVTSLLLFRLSPELP